MCPSQLPESNRTKTRTDCELLLGSFKVYPWFCVCRKFSSSFLFEVFRYFVLRVQFELSFFCGCFQKMISLKFVSQQIITVCPTIKTYDMLPACLPALFDWYIFCISLFKLLVLTQRQLVVHLNLILFLKIRVKTSRLVLSAKEIALKTALSAKIIKKSDLNSSLIWYHC